MTLFRLYVMMTIQYIVQEYAMTDAGPLHAVPLTFADKQVFTVSIENAIVSGGDEAVIASFCELYPTKGLATIVCL